METHLVVLGVGTIAVIVGAAIALVIRAAARERRRTVRLDRSLER